jgi:methyltransferase
MSLHVYVWIVLAVGAERLVELGVSQRHLRWLAGRGAVEYGAGHYPAMVALHVGLLAGCVLEADLSMRLFHPVVGWTMLAVVLASQALRWWCVGTLGQRWTTRVLVIPGVPPIRRGPYRWLRHPNYVAVVVEGIALPLIWLNWVTAVVFTLLNAAVLAVRIGTENRALEAAYPS